MDAILRGVEHFQKHVFPRQRELYQTLASGQDPYALVIACSDSRVVPSDITQSKPGDLFICRNAGNIVPAYSETPGGITATIEYAVMVLQVRAIIVWGHTNCGAMKGLLYPEKLASLRAVSAWLHHADRARAMVDHLMPEAPEHQKLRQLAHENVAAQLDNLRTHPYVAAALAQRTVTLHGWLFDIETGQLEAYDESNRTWAPLISHDAPPAEATQ
jgi:carbonic anhydrase